jgi:hypothetical protein
MKKYYYWNQLKANQRKEVLTQFVGWHEHELRGKRFSRVNGVWHAFKPDPKPVTGINTIGMAVNNFDEIKPTGTKPND